MSAAEILREIGPACRDERRRALIIENTITQPNGQPLNGIDFVEYRQIPSAGRHPELTLHGGSVCHVLEAQFLRPVPPDGFGLEARLDHVLVDGGSRIPSIKPLLIGLRPGRPDLLEIEVAAQGDFSIYQLALGWTDRDGLWRFQLGGVDRQFSISPVTFRADCPQDFDCAVDDSCEPASLPEPRLDYMAKDYASFRQVLLDLLAERHPEWLERNAADLGMTLLELFAYEGDQLSYFQDAVANEAYLETARQRISAKRHAHLVDYEMHDGRNAWTYVQFEVDADGNIPYGQMLLTRIDAPLHGQTAPPGPLLVDVDDDSAFDADPMLAAATAYEMATSLRARRINQSIRIHTWGGDECCLPAGATSVQLFSRDTTQLALAVRPDLRVGDLLLLEEIRSAAGVTAEADPAHRVVVRITEIDATLTDPVFRRELTPGGALRTSTGQEEPLPLLGVSWDRTEALRFPFCISAKDADGTVHSELVVASGNLALADHGRTVTEVTEFVAPIVAGSRLRLPLRRGPLTMQFGPTDARADPVTGRCAVERPRLDGPVGEARPALALLIDGSRAQTTLWQPVATLLDSDQFDQDVVAEIAADGRATLRFGDNEYGQEPVGARRIKAVFRVGNGLPGLIGAESLAHVRPIPGTNLAGWPAITRIRNPLPSLGAADPQTIEEVRQVAPAAFRAEQFRAVTPEDYHDAAMKVDGVAGAAAAFRWTGSWYTALVAIDPEDPADLISEPGGFTHLSRTLGDAVRATLGRYRLAGYDLEVRAARYVPLRLVVDLCVRPGYFKSDVAHEVELALRPGRWAGTTGLFDPAGFSFGDPVYLSRVYERIERVEGVESANVTAFERYDRTPAGELESGILPIGPWEIARLDDDANRMELGVLTVTAGGGK